MEIENCQSCPFANNDNEYGLNNCNLKDFNLSEFEELPEETIHKECPLIEKDYTIRLKV